MIRAQRAPGGPVRYYNDLIDQLFNEREHFLENNGNNREFEELESSADIDEITRYLFVILPENKCFLVWSSRFCFGPWYTRVPPLILNPVSFVCSVT